jgi:hypothetical protein
LIKIIIVRRFNSRRSKRSFNRRWGVYRLRRRIIYWWLWRRWRLWRRVSLWRRIIRLRLRIIYWWLGRSIVRWIRRGWRFGRSIVYRLGQWSICWRSICRIIIFTLLSRIIYFGRNWAIWIIIIIIIFHVAP